MIKFLNKETRYQVPRWWTHMSSNHDIVWLFQDDIQVSPDERFPFYLKLVRVAVLQLILLCAVAFLFGNGEYFYNECQRRKKCMTYCQEAYFPLLTCSDSGYMLNYKGNEYTHLWSYPYYDNSEYRTCYSYMSDNPDYSTSEWDSDRQERLHTCFPACKTGNDEDYTDDTRPTCTDSSEDPGMICVRESDSCEQVYLPSRVGEVDGISYDIGYAWIAIAIANCFQYIYLYIIIFTLGLKSMSINNIKIGFMKCGVETVILVISGLCSLLIVYQATLIDAYGPSLEFWFTFFVAFMIDQSKSFVFHTGVWYFLFRRCGYLKTNEEDFIDPAWKHKDDQAQLSIRGQIAKVMETNQYKFCSMGFLGIYAVYVLAILSIGSNNILDIIDVSFIGVFLFEIVVATWVNCMKNFFDLFNIFDAVIVSVSFILYFVGVGAKGLAVLRLLRLVRLIIVLRKVTANTQRKSSGYSTVYEESLAILRMLKNQKKLSFKQKKELNWVIGIIESGKLYDVVVAQQNDKGNGQVSQDNEGRKWINMATIIANDPLLWFDRDLDDYLYERQRDDEPEDNKDEFEEEIRQIIGISEKTHFQLEKIFDDIGKWRFNAFQYFDLCGPQVVSHFIIRLFKLYDISRKFEIPMMSLKTFSTAIYEGYSSTNPYHNAIHAIDVAHKLNYFILTGDLMKYISDLDIMAALIAAIIHDFQHPGVTNEFLIKRSHSKAIRYNDFSVLERHHLASAFAALLDQSCDITINLTEDQYWLVRTTIVKMVLSTDLKLHDKTLGSFKNSRNIPNFPNNDKERQILLNIALRIADNGNPLQPQDLYFKWMALMMEEFYQQGDIEEHLNMELTAPFMDRKSTNPYNSQLAYIEVVVEPMVEIWIEFIPEVKEDIYTRGLLENKEALKQKSDTVPKLNNEEDTNEIDMKRKRKEGMLMEK